MKWIWIVALAALLPTSASAQVFSPSSTAAYALFAAQSPTAPLAQPAPPLPQQMSQEQYIYLAQMLQFFIARQDQLLQEQRNLAAVYARDAPEYQAQLRRLIEDKAIGDPTKWTQTIGIIVAGGMSIANQVKSCKP